MQMKYKILIIDNEDSEVSEIIDTDFSSEGVEIEMDYEKSFEIGMEKIQNNKVDILVLDLKKDSDTYEGKGIFDKIWNGANSFLPIIIFSTNLNRVDNIQKHPLIFKFNKSQEVEVINTIKNIIPKLSKIDKLKIELNKYFREGLRVIDEVDEKMLTYRMSYYIKNFLENYQEDSLKLHPDIQYIVLPEYFKLYTCDILKKITTDVSLNSLPVFSMILTPSCDMQKKNDAGELELIDEILCKRIIKHPAIKEDRSNESSVKGEVKSKVNDGCDFRTGHIYLPDHTFSGELKFEKMIIDAKSSIVIKQAKISLDPEETDIIHYQYKKIASIASPFRERIIALCYGHVSRIGVPDLDKDKWW